MDDEARIRALNSKFYEAFESLDYAEMASCWSQRGSDICVHPGWAPLHGWTTIRNSWRTILANTGYMRVRPTDVRVRIDADLAVLTCVEQLYSVAESVTVQGAVACTHVFERVEGVWKLTLHHGSPIAASQRATTGDDSGFN